MVIKLSELRERVAARKAALGVTDADLLAIAEDQGLWEEHGIDATTSSFTNGPLQIQALGTGDLDFGYIGPGAMWLPASGQAKVIAVNTLGGADRVIAQPGTDSLEDLAGKTLITSAIDEEKNPTPPSPTPAVSRAGCARCGPTPTCPPAPTST